MSLSNLTFKRMFFFDFQWLMHVVYTAARGGAATRCGGFPAIASLSGPPCLDHDWYSSSPSYFLFHEAYHDTVAVV